MIFLKKALLPLLLAAVLTAVSCTHTEDRTFDGTTETTDLKTESVTEFMSKLVTTTVVTETETAEEITATTATTTTAPITTTVKRTEPTTEYTVLPPTTVPTTIAAYYDENTANEILERTNKERAKRFLPPLELSESLCDAAKIRSHEISIVFSHTRPDGSSCDTVYTQDIGENIAYGQTSYDDVFSAWMNSSAHKKNILNEQYTQMGAYCFVDSNGIKYWAQLFII